MIGPLLLVIGLFGLWALAKGKAGPVLDAITNTSFSTSLQNEIGKIDVGVTHGVNIPGVSNGASVQQSGTSLFNVPIIGPDGGAGTIQVDAHDAASAIINASQGGNTVAGAAVAV